MSNYNKKLNQIHFILDTSSKEKIKTGFYNIFSQDCDFTENEEYFREDTLSLGYKDEADRLLSEYLFGKTFNTLKSVETMVDKLCSEVFANDCFYGAYESDVIRIDNNLYSVSIGYIY